MTSLKNRDTYVYIGGRKPKKENPKAKADDDDEDSHAEREDEVDPQEKHRKKKHHRGNRRDPRKVNGKIIGILIMALLILILFGILIYYIIALFDTLELVTNCKLYNKNGVGTIPKECPEGREYYEGLCYKKCLNGYTRSAACTCNFGNIYTDCIKYGTTTLPMTCTDSTREYYGSTCVKKCPDDFRRTAGCSCEKGEFITDCEKYGNHTFPVICPSDREYYAGTCVKKCPADYTRTASCSCEKGDLITNCQLYGAKKLPDICPSGRELYGSTCVKQCPAGYTRTAACTCVRGNFQTSCEQYGFKTVLQCPPGKIYVAGLCYDGCPDGGERVAACTCSYGGSMVAVGRPASGCPASYPYEIAGLCYARSGVLTSCEHFGSSISIPNSCASEHEIFASACYGKCPAESPRTSFCTCSNFDIVTDCFQHGDAKAIGDPSGNGPSCGPDAELYGGLCYGKCPVDMPRTAACTCSSKDVMTSCLAYGDGKPVGDDLGPQCDNSVSQYYGGLCYQQKCPDGMDRKAGCTCSNFELTTNCMLYGDPKGLLDELGPRCTPDEEYFGGFCYKEKCPLDQKRTAACTCDNFETTTDCDLYGDGRGVLDKDDLGPRCKEDEDYHAGLCYKDKCPVGFRRSAICTCQRLKTLRGFLGLDGYANQTLS